MGRRTSRRGKKGLKYFWIQNEGANRSGDGGGNPVSYVYDPGSELSDYKKGYDNKYHGTRVVWEKKNKKKRSTHNRYQYHGVKNETPS